MCLIITTLLIITALFLWGHWWWVRLTHLKLTVAQESSVVVPVWFCLFSQLRGVLYDFPYKNYYALCCQIHQFKDFPDHETVVEVIAEIPLGQACLWEKIWMSVMIITGCISFVFQGAYGLCMSRAYSNVTVNLLHCQIICINVVPSIEIHGWCKWVHYKPSLQQNRG